MKRNKNWYSLHIGVVLSVLALVLFLGVWRFGGEFARSVEQSDAQVNLPTWYVSPNGNDSWSGLSPEVTSPNGPFRTIQRAQQVYREAKRQGRTQAGARIVLRGGSYDLGQGLVFTDEDSGQSGRLFIVAYNNEQPVISGAREISESALRTDIPANVASRFQTQYRGVIKKIDGAMFGRVVGPKYKSWVDEKNDYATELYFENQQVGTLARWPNDNGIKRTAEANVKWSRYTDGSIDTYTFKYRSDQGRSPDNWNLAVNDIWLHGFFQEDWADYFVKVKGINASTDTITMDKDVSPLRRITSGKRYYAFNVLEEIDRPGEYVVDERNNAIYVFPLTVQSKMYVATQTQPLISCRDARNIGFGGLSLRYSRGDGFNLNGCENIVVENNKFFGLARTAIHVERGRGVIVNNNEIKESAHGVIVKNSGNRSTLQSSEVVVENNEISRIGRLIRSYFSAVEISNSVGVVVRKNVMYDLPHQAIQLGSSNNSMIELNEIFYVLQETSDAGAIYVGREWDSQGNVIRHNFIHETDFSQELNLLTSGVYLDDGFAGMRIEGNIFFDTGNAVFSKGPLNKIRNNVFLRNSSKASTVDGMGATWVANVSSSYVDGFLSEMAQTPFNSTTWKNAYPEWRDYIDKVRSGAISKGMPYKTEVKDNLFVQNTHNISTWTPYFSEPYPSKFGILLSPNITRSDDPGYVNTGVSPAQLRSGSPIVGGFAAIPLSEIRRDKAKRYLGGTANLPPTTLMPSPVMSVQPSVIASPSVRASTLPSVNPSSSTGGIKPSQPENLSAVCGNNSVTLSWSESTGASSYFVRLDNLKDSWSPPQGCKNLGYNYPSGFVGDRCIDGVVARSISLAVENGVGYKTWVHGVNSNGYNGGFSEPTYREFTCNAAAQTKEMVVRALGTRAGGEYAAFGLQQNEQGVSFRLVGETQNRERLETSAEMREYRLLVPTDLNAENLRINFVNDEVVVVSGVREDRNLRIDYVRIDGEVLQSEASTTYSVGSWDANKCEGGFKRSEWLHCGGYFRYR